MKELVINKIAITGFKNHKDRVEFNLSRKTLIIGDNGKGKTTLGEAIVWCLLGCDLTGNERATSRLVNNGSKITEVEMDFTFNGEKHNLIRHKKGKTIDIYLDDKKVKNEDLAEFYRDKDVFLSIFNPTYFPNLTPKNAKSLLHSILREVSNEEVFEKMLDFTRNLLKSNNFRNSNLFLEAKREELKEIEDDIVYLEGFIDAKNEGIEIPEEMQFDDTELNELREKAIKLEQELLNTKSVDKDITNVRIKLDSYRSEYSRLSQELKSLNNKIKCPKCNTEIDLDSTRKENILQRLEEIKTKGTELKTKLELLEEENKKIQVENLNKTVELETIKAIIRELEEEKQKVNANNATREKLLKLQEESKARVIKAKKDIEEAENKKNQIKMQIDAAKEFNSIKLRLQAENINKHLDKVSIQLQKIIKSTGEIKDDFKILYDGRDFNVLSNSERIRAGLEIANLIMNEIKIAFPIFIDNAESITVYKAPDTQIIEAKVKEGSLLKIEVA